MNGSMPYNNQENLHHQLQFTFPFDSHPGPLKDAITDAKNLNRSLFIFIYFADNPNTNHVVKILQKESIANEIHSNFIFIPLDVSYPEGWHSACELEFTEIPTIIILRPNGTTLSDSRVFAILEGRIDESDLLSSIQIENNQRTQDAAIIQQQNEEFNDAVQQDQEVTREEAEEEQRARKQIEDEEEQRKKVEKEFEELPETNDSTDIATIRFQFPDNINRIHKFPRDQKIDLLFVFVRKFMFPKKFILKTGFPQFRIEENGKLISEVCHEKNFIVHVEEEE
ncbi:FAS-associated factor 2 [Histomonas meleagridis]|uniref:FAS-associated factor 2 n=1 Tax=Histomonas meleagridis TaxID=135588 RepID=UPI003559B045|nr:FAS-associated factor 2 [Histomonas meleagridis]KAH0804242.1 FAS-associated factor 2 [Histomonas meleagridis]